MRLVIENLTGTLFFVELESNATLAELKSAIGAQENLPCDRLIFVLAADLDRPIIDDDDESDMTSLADHGVRDGSHIYIFFSPLEDEDEESNNGFLFGMPGSPLWWHQQTPWQNDTFF